LEAKTEWLFTFFRMGADVFKEQRTARILRLSLNWSHITNSEQCTMMNIDVGKYTLRANETF